MKRKFDLLIISSIASNLFYSLSYPVVHTYLMSLVNPRTVSICSLISCIIVASVNKTWLKYSKKLYKYFKHLLITEAIVYSALIGMVLSNAISPCTYYILDTLLFATITNNIICGGVKLKSLRYQGEKREKFDNTINYWANISCIIGFLISSIVTFSWEIGFIIIFISVVIDNGFYYIAYEETKKINSP